MTFDQTADIAAVEERMLDSCVIERDSQRETDDVINPVTLALEPPANDATTIYEGVCSIAPYIRDENRTEGQRETTRQLWRASVPISASLPQYGDRLIVTAIHEGGDQALVGRRFVVERIGAHTLGVRRPLVLMDEKGATVR